MEFNNSRLIRVPAGIGDNVWLAMKLVNAPNKERFDFQLCGGQPRRGKQIFDLLPQLTRSAVYADGLKFPQVKEIAGSLPNDFGDINTKSFALECNTHLEKGGRIEEYLPDLATTWELNYVTTGSGFEEYLLPGVAAEPRPKYIGIYCSSYSTSRSWNFWNERQWFDLIQKIYLEYEPHEVCFVTIGAMWDIDLTSKLIKLMRDNAVPHYDTVGKPLAWVVDCLKSLDYFIGFPSGLSIINETLHKKTMMFYPEHLNLMRYAWAEPERIKSGEYLAPLFCEPSEAFELFKTQSGLI